MYIINISISYFIRYRQHCTFCGLTLLKAYQITIIPIKLATIEYTEYWLTDSYVLCVLKHLLRPFDRSERPIR